MTRWSSARWIWTALSWLTCPHSALVCPNSNTAWYIHHPSNNTTCNISRILYYILHPVINYSNKMIFTVVSLGVYHYHFLINGQQVGKFSFQNVKSSYNLWQADDKMKRFSFSPKKISFPTQRYNLWKICEKRWGLSFSLKTFSFATSLGFSKNTSLAATIFSRYVLLQNSTLPIFDKTF